MNITTFFTKLDVFYAKFLQFFVTILKTRFGNDVQGKYLPCFYIEMWSKSDAFPYLKKGFSPSTPVISAIWNIHTKNPAWVKEQPVTVCPVLSVSSRKPTVATVVKGYGGWAGRATSVSTANCWSISAVTDSSLRPAKGLWWVFHHVVSSRRRSASLAYPTLPHWLGFMLMSDIKLHAVDMITFPQRESVTHLDLRDFLFKLIFIVSAIHRLETTADKWLQESFIY